MTEPVEDCALCYAPTAFTLHRKHRFIWLCYACQRVAAKPALEQVAQLKRQVRDLHTRHSEYK